MKVLYIVTAYPRHEQDVITPWMGETIDRLQRSGVQVEVLAPAYKGSPDGTINGVKVHRFRYAPAALETLTHDMPALDRIARNPLFTSLLPSYVAAGAAAARRLARDGNFDVVHAFWPIPHGVFGLAARDASRSALVSTFFSAELNWKGATRRVFAPLLRRIVTQSDAVTVISTYTGRRLRQYVPRVETVTIPFGAVATRKVSGVAGRRTFATDEFDLLFVGRLVRRKGVDVLLHAAKLLADDERLRIRIVGDGPERQRLEQLAASMDLGRIVSFEGVIDEQRIDTLFDQCDALVLPAIVTESGDTEGLGVVLIEAMGYGKPVIASAAGGIVDIVRADETGLLVPPGEPAALASAIRRAMDHPAEMAAMAERGSAFAESAFGWDAIIGRLAEVYYAAVKARHPHWRES